MKKISCYLPEEVLPVLYAHGGIDKVAASMIHLVNCGKIPVANLIIENVPKDECKQMPVYVDDGDYELLLTLLPKSVGVRTVLLYFIQYEFWNDPVWQEEYQRNRELQIADDVAKLLARCLTENVPVESISKILKTAERTLYDYLEGKVVSRI